MEEQTLEVSTNKPEESEKSVPTEKPVPEKPKNARTPKQELATQRMIERRHVKKEEVPDKEKEKSLELAAAMFMDMKQKAKDEKKELMWERNLNKRFDEFEERLVDIFTEPIDHFLSRSKKRKTNNDTVPKKMEEEPIKKAPEKPKEIKKKVINNPFRR
jgi:hypothetical protein